MANKNKKDTDEFEYRQGKSVITGKSGDPNIVRLAEREQRYRFIFRCGFLVLGGLSLIFNGYPEYIPLAALIDYVKSTIFKA